MQKKVEDIKCEKCVGLYRLAFHLGLGLRLPSTTVYWSGVIPILSSATQRGDQSTCGTLYSPFLFLSFSLSHTHTPLEGKESPGTECGMGWDWKPGTECGRGHLQNHFSWPYRKNGLPKFPVVMLPSRGVCQRCRAIDPTVHLGN